MTIHLAITHRIFLKAILNGQKTIETRFTKVKCTPFNKVKPGDKVILKETGGKISAEYIVDKVQYFIKQENDNLFEELKKYSNKIQSNLVETFWEDRKDKKYITFIYIRDVRLPTKNYKIFKKDKRGWVTYDSEDSIIN